MEITRNQIKLVKSLHRKKERVEQGLFIVEGRKSVAEALKVGLKPELLFHLKEIVDFQEYNEAIPVSYADMERITALSSPSEALAVFKTPINQVLSDKIEDKLLFYLDGIQDPGNLGTIIRIADWFDLKTMVCSHDCVETHNPKTVQSSMGSIFRVKIVRADASEIVNKLKSTHRFLCAELDGKSIWEIPLASEQAVILAIGSEAHGIKSETLLLADEKVTIPGGGEAESLNAAISAGIMASALLR